MRLGSASLRRTLRFELGHFQTWLRQMDGGDEHVDQLDPQEGGDETADSVDEEVAAEQRLGRHGLIADSAEGERDEGDYDEGVEDDRREDGGLGCPEGPDV